MSGFTSRTSESSIWKVSPVGDFIPGVQRIAVLRAGGVGDFAFASIDLAEVRTHAPDLLGMR